jgi:hypothetical protein
MNWMDLDVFLGIFFIGGWMGGDGYADLRQIAGTFASVRRNPSLEIIPPFWYRSITEHEKRVCPHCSFSKSFLPQKKMSTGVSTTHF